MKVALGFVFMISCTVVANLLMKLGAIGMAKTGYCGLSIGRPWPVFFRLDLQA